jgi:hypothetical protein
MAAGKQSVNELFEAQDGLATRTQLLALGVPASTIRYRARPQGPWRCVLKGTISNRGGPLTRWQRLRAALLFAGPGAVVTGFAALWAYGAGLGTGIGVRVLIPHARRLKPDGFVVVTRTTRLPPPAGIGHFALAPPARAAVDACLRARNLEVVCGVVTAVVRSGLCSLAELAHELEAHQIQHSAGLRAVLSRCRQRHPQLTLPAAGLTPRTAAR